MVDPKDVYVLKPSREGQTIAGKALFGANLSQADIQRYKNAGYAHWFMVKPQPQVEPIEAPKMEAPKMKAQGVEKLTKDGKEEAQAE